MVDEDEKVVNNAYTLGGNLEVWFLIEGEKLGGTLFTRLQEHTYSEYCTFREGVSCPRPKDSFISLPGFVVYLSSFISSLCLASIFFVVFTSTL